MTTYILGKVGSELEDTWKDIELFVNPWAKKLSDVEKINNELDKPYLLTLNKLWDNGKLSRIQDIEQYRDIIFLIMLVNGQVASAKKFLTANFQRKNKKNHVLKTEFEIVQL